MAEETLSLQKINVKSMISIFENQTVSVNNEPTVLLKRTKSVGHLSTKRPVKRGSDNTPPPGKNLELAQIQHQARHLQRTLGNYKKYSRENHIYYQNQIFFLLTDIVNVDAQDDASVITEKSELIELMKRLNKGLNALLPSAAKRGKSESSSLKKERSFEERKPEPPRVKEDEPPQKVEVAGPEEEEREEVDAPAPSVKSLKQMFEKNTTEIEVKREFGTKITRKFNTFNSTADSKYIPYSERFKAIGELKSHVVAETTEETVTSTISRTFDSVKSHTVFSEEEEEKVIENGDEQLESMEHISRDSLASSSSSSSDSDGEQDEKDDGLS